LITLASRKTSSEQPRNTRPPVVRLGSSIGRRTIIESNSIRSRNTPETAKIHQKPRVRAAIFADSVSPTYSRATSPGARSTSPRRSRLRTLQTRLNLKNSAIDSSDAR